MPWFFIDDAFADSKPVMALDRSLRNEAIGLWVRCGAWSAKEETDGLVPIDIVKGFGGSPRLIKALQESAQLWVRISPESGPKSGQNLTGIQFKNWEKWQKTRAENEAKRKREAEKKQTWRAAKKGRDYVASSDDSEMSTRDSVVDTDEASKFVSTADTPGESTGVSRYPDPTRPDPTHSLVVTKEGGGHLGDDPEPPRYCSKHPNDTAGSCPACIPLRKAHDAWKKRAEKREDDELESRRQQKITAAKALADCRLCDDDGWVLGSDGAPVDPAKKCTSHQEAKNA